MPFSLLTWSRFDLVESSYTFSVLYVNPQQFRNQNSPSGEARLQKVHRFRVGLLHIEPCHTSGASGLLKSEVEESSLGLEWVYDFCGLDLRLTLSCTVACIYSSVLCYEITTGATKSLPKFLQLISIPTIAPVYISLDSDSYFLNLYFTL
jgi:hypothetical protein